MKRLSSYPQVEWRGPSEGRLIVKVTGMSEKEGPFLCVMMSRHLVSGKFFPLMSYRRFLTEDSGWVTEVEVAISPEHVIEATRALPDVIQEVSFGAQSVDHAEKMLQIKGRRGTVAVCKALFPFVDQGYGLKLLTTAQRVFLSWEEGFSLIRPASYLRRVITTCHALLAADDQARAEVAARCFRGRLSFPYGTRRVIGIVVVVSPLNAYETFKKRHFMRKLQELVPHGKPVEDSYFCFRCGDAKRVFFIELLAEGLDFRQVREAFKRDSVERVERLSPSLINQVDETGYHLAALSHRLETRNAPQVRVQLQFAKEQKLHFEVILVRWVDKQAQPFSKLFSQDELACFVEHTSLIEGSKEAAILRIEIPKDPFLRSDYGIDLLRAYAVVFSQLEQILGPLDDCYGESLAVHRSRLLEVDQAIAKRSNFDQTERVLRNLVPSMALGYLEVGGLVEIVLAFDLLQEGRDRVVMRRVGDYWLIALRCLSKEVSEVVVEGVEGFHWNRLDYTLASLSLRGIYDLVYLYHGRADQGDTFSERVVQLFHGAQEADQGFVRLCLPLSTSFLDPRLAPDRICGIAIKMLYEGLTRLNLDNEPELAVAEKVEIFEEGLRYRFTLRSTVWSDGSPLKAEDFVYGWKKALDPTLQSMFSFLFHPIQGAEQVALGKLPVDQLGVEALGDYLLEVRLDYPCPSFLELLTLWVFAPLNREQDASHPGWSYFGKENYICNGPFKPSLWSRGKRLCLVKNSRYWDAEFVLTKGIDIGISDSAQHALNLFRRGKIDWIGDPLWELPFQSLPDLRQDDRFSCAPSASLFGLVLNVTSFPLNLLPFRQALSYAIDRRSLVDTLLRSGERPAMGYIPPMLGGVDYFHEYNPELALAKFQQALLLLGYSTISSISILHSDHDEHIALVRFIGECWERVLGIEVRYECRPWAELVERQILRDYVVSASSFFYLYSAENYLLERLGSTDPRVNFTGWNSREYTYQLELAKRAKDRLEAFQRAEKIAIDHMPLIPVYFSQLRWLTNPRLQRVVPSSTGQTDFRWAKIDG